MEKFPASLTAKLSRRIADGSLRQLPDAGMLTDFASNDYLGFAKSELLFDAAHNYLLQSALKRNGATGSRLLSGNHELYSITEELIKTCHNAESAVIFNSGYDANLGFFSSVPQKGDVVLYDEYIHASIRDGIKLGNAITYKFKHNSTEALKKAIARHRDDAAELYIVTESVFSMDGDSPDLNAFIEIAREYNCRLVVDEAHAIGVFGEKGEGLLNGTEDVFARIITFGKAMGCHGAAILCCADLKQYLVNFARSFIYTTALPPHALATIVCAYRQLMDTSARKQLADNISYFKAIAYKLGLGFIASDSAIHCIVIPGNEKVKAAAQHLQAAGYNVRPILSPTVPAGSERLRFCLHSYNTQKEIQDVLTVLKDFIQP